MGQKDLAAPTCSLGHTQLTGECAWAHRPEISTWTGNIEKATPPLALLGEIYTCWGLHSVRFTHRFSHLAGDCRSSKTPRTTSTLSWEGRQRICTQVMSSKRRQRTHRVHRKGAVPAEKGVRDWHSETLSGTAVLGGEGHFRLLDTVGDRRERRGSIGGLLRRGEKAGDTRHREREHRKGDE